MSGTLEHLREVVREGGRDELAEGCGESAFGCTGAPGADPRPRLILAMGQPASGRTHR
jgi:hypothetical protein